jgi:hypothetical protein
LHETKATACRDCTHTLSSVGIAAAEYNTNDTFAVGFRRRDKQRIGSRAGEVNLWTLIQTDRAEAQSHVMVSRSHVNPASRDGLTVPSESCWETATRVEEVGEMAPVCADVLYDKHGGAAGSP